MRPRRSSLATSNGMTVSSAVVADGALDGITIWGSVMAGSIMAGLVMRLI